MALSVTVQGCALVNTTMDRITSVQRYDGKTALNANITPNHYTVKLTVDPNRDTFVGRVIMTLNLAEQTRYIPLHGGELNVQSVVVEQNGVLSQGEALPGPNGGLLIRTPEALKMGDAVVTIRYEGSARKTAPGLFRFQVGQHSYAMTQTNAGGAHRIFPCMDRPKLKVPIKLYLTIPDGFTAVANERQVETRVRDGQREFQFAESAPMAPEMLMFAVGRFQVVSAPKKPGYPAIRVMTSPGKGLLATQLVETIGPLVEELGSFFGQPIDHKVDVLALPKLGASMTSAPGLFAFREKHILRLPKDESAVRKTWLRRVLVSQLSRRWLGHSVSVASDHDRWLYEGLSVWIRDKLKGVDTGSVSTQSALVPWLINRELVRRPRQIEPSVLDHANDDWELTKLDVGRVYTLLNMLEKHVGLNQIQAALRTVIREKQDQAVSADDILSIIDEQSRAETRTIAKWYLKQSGVPLVRMTLQCQDNAVNVRVSQERARVPAWNQAQGNPWAIPVCLRYGDDQAVKTHCHLLAKRTDVITLPSKTCPEFLFGNANHQGLYLWTTSQPVFERSLAANSALTKRERSGLPHHLLNLLLIGEVDAELYSNWLSRLSAQGQPSVVYSILDSLDMVRRVAVSANRAGEFRSWLFTTILNAQTLTTWLKDESQQRRLQLLTMGNPAETNDELRVRALALLNTPYQMTTHGLSNTLVLAASQGDNGLWETLSKKLGEKRSQPVFQYAYGRALGAFKNSQLFKNTLDLARTTVFSPRALEAMARNVHNDNREIAWTWLMKHQAQLNQRQSGLAIKIGTALIRNFCSQARLAEFKTLIGQARRDDMENIDRIRIAQKDVEDCVQLSNLLQPTFIQFLGKKSTD
ncbi:MAG: hypothetical protein CMH52_04185 [Myxococcales bacterium]|nr:hypothetical protein [Myxococcales bacterium]